MEDGRKTGREGQRGRAGGTRDSLARAPGSRPGGESHETFWILYTANHVIILSQKALQLFNL